MGIVKRDVNKTAITHDTIHAYTEDGIERLLNDIHKLPHEESLKGDINATVIRLDLENCLNSKCLNAKQRQAVALYYFACLNQDECAEVLSVDQSVVSRRLDAAIFNIAYSIGGELINTSQSHEPKYCSYLRRNIKKWLDDVVSNKNKWWIIPQQVWYDINAMFDYVRDDNDTYNDDNDIEYPFFTDSQMEWKQRKEIPRPEIYPREANYGTRRDEFGKRQRLVPRY